MFPFNITISKELKEKCPDFNGAAIYAEVKNSKCQEGLWIEIKKFTQHLCTTSHLDEIKQHPAIFATRVAYKSCGKDPNRYRPSAEALRRRLLRGFDLYQIDTLVDIINFVSLQTGFSIGGFDAQKIKGTSLTLGIGREGEPYQAIGRGLLNVSGLPIYRDSFGGIGTPTSDHERTKLDVSTTTLLVLINSYSGEKKLHNAAYITEGLLKRYCSMTSCHCFFY